MKRDQEGSTCSHMFETFPCEVYILEENWSTIYDVVLHQN